MRHTALYNEKSRINFDDEQIRSETSHVYAKKIQMIFIHILQMSSQIHKQEAQGHRSAHFCLNWKLVIQAKCYLQSLVYQSQVSKVSKTLDPITWDLVTVVLKSSKITLERLHRLSLVVVQRESLFKTEHIYTFKGAKTSNDFLDFWKTLKLTQKCSPYTK